MKYFKTLLIACLLFPFMASAQQRPDSDEIESLRVAIFTKRMNLSPEESKVFWPIYDVYRNAMNQLYYKRRERLEDLRTGIASLREDQIAALVEDEVSYYEQQAALARKYNAEFKKILPVKKVAQLYVAEEAFKRELIKRLRGADE